MDDKDDMILVHSSQLVMVHEDDLAHYGVAGMKWGKRTRSGGTSNKQLRSMDRQSKKNDRAARDGEIDAARDRNKTVNRGKLKEAKATYKSEKHTIGKREARKTLNKVRSDVVSDIQTAQLSKSGKERALAMTGAGVGALLVGTIRTA